MGEASLKDINRFKKSLWNNVSSKCSEDKWYYQSKYERIIFYILALVFAFACFAIFNSYEFDRSKGKTLIDSRNSSLNSLYNIGTLSSSASN